MVQTNINLEVWLRGPVADVPDLLQPVAHALLQAQEEVHALMSGFSDALLWQQPAGLASPGFHLQHLAGVLDRLFTYASVRQLSQEQLEYLAKEGKEANLTVAGLVHAFSSQVDISLAQLRVTNEQSLTHFRAVGRAQLPSTILGLLVHAAEHTQRHVGQLLVTAKVLMASSSSG